MDLISKKDLLTETGISYGQLYRWKRERLIPEEWFIKQSAFTGQETFFPREQTLSRIKMILELKDDHSLEELSRILLSDSDLTVTRERLAEARGIEDGFVDTIAESLGKDRYSIGETAAAYAVYRAAKKGGIAGSEIISLIARSAEAMRAHPVNDSRCTIVRADGRVHACFTGGPALPRFDEGLETVSMISVGETMNELRILLEDKNAKSQR